MAARIIDGGEWRIKADLQTLGEFFFEKAETFSDQICQIDGNTSESETYASVKQRSTRLAIQLQKRNITSSDVILICSRNSMDNTIPLLAGLYLGAKTANLDPTLSVRHTKHLISLVAPKIIFSDEASLQLIESSLSELQKPEIIVLGKSEKYTQFSDLIIGDPMENHFRPVKVDIHDTSIMFFSSGTTGLPKAICHSHLSFLNGIYIFESVFKEGDESSTRVTLHFTSFYWISALIVMGGQFVSGGVRIFCKPTAQVIFNAIEKHKVTSMFTAPIITYELTNNAHLIKNYDISSFKKLMMGGTAISLNHFRRIREVFKNISIQYGYGMTECSVFCMFTENPHDDFISKKIGTCGKPIPGVMMKVVDPKTGELLGPNARGEICIKNPAIMKGYYKIENNALDKDGFLKSGDLGYYDEDGCFYIVDRIKEMFKYLSWHIVPTSLEEVLLEHPAVKEAVVFGVPQGDEGEAPAAGVVLNDNFKVSAEEIQQFVADRVVDRERLRAGVFFLEEIPKGPSGKAMRQEVRKLFVK